MPPARPKSLPRVINFRASISPSIILSEIYKTWSNQHSREPRWKPSSDKIVQRCKLDSTINKNTLNELQKCYTKNGPILQNNNNFANKVLQLCSFAASPNKVPKWLPNKPQRCPKIFSKWGQRGYTNDTKTNKKTQPICLQIRFWSKPHPNEPPEIAKIG